MANPYVPDGSPSLIEALKRDAMHEKDLWDALEALCKSCAAEGIPFGVIGAIAMRANGFIRHTENLDIVTTSEGLALIHERLVGRGISSRGSSLGKKLRDTVHNVNIDVFESGGRAGSKESPILFPDPRGPEFALEKKGVRYATLSTLVTLKLAAGIWGERMSDLADVIRLIRANTLDERFATQLSEPVRAKYLELLAASRRQKDEPD